MEKLDYWRLCDELSVVQAALLAVDVDPDDFPHLMDLQVNKRPENFSAMLTALSNAILGGHLPATIRRKSWVRGWGEEPNIDEKLTKSFDIFPDLNNGSEEAYTRKDKCDLSDQAQLDIKAFCNYVGTFSEFHGCESHELIGHIEDFFKDLRQAIGERAHRRLSNGDFMGLIMYVTRCLDYKYFKKKWEMMEQETLKILNRAEHFAHKHRGKRIDELKDGDQRDWIVLFMYLHSVLAICDNEMPEQVEGRINLFMSSGLGQTSNHLRTAN